MDFHMNLGRLGINRELVEITADSEIYHEYSGQMRGIVVGVGEEVGVND